MIVIIDYGFGNLGSIANMFKKVGVQAVMSSDATVIERGDKLILPGVGAFDNGMKNLCKHGRYVIWKHGLPGAPGLLVAPDYETLIDHIKPLLERHKTKDLMLNYEGADFVHTHYAPEIITDEIRGRFRELISRQD
jgi:hypothetical protein